MVLFYMFYVSLNVAFAEEWTRILLWMDFVKLFCLESKTEMQYSAMPIRSNEMTTNIRYYC